MKKYYNKIFIIIIFLIVITASQVEIVKADNVDAVINGEQEEEEIDSDITDKTNDKKIYDSLKEKSQENIENGKKIINNASDKAKEKVNDGVYNFWEWYFSVHAAIAKLTPYIIIFSIAFGIVIVVFARKNKAIRQWAIFGFCIVIPILDLLVVYGMPYIKYITVINEEQKVEKANTYIADKTDDEKIYDSLKEKSQENIENGKKIINNASDKAKEKIIAGVYNFWEGYFGVHAAIAKLTPYIIISSIAFGIITVVFTLKNKVIRQWAIFGFCITIPMLDLLVVYGMPYLIRIFK